MSAGNELKIGIDLGGTNIKGGLVDASGTLVQRRSIETQGAGGFQHVLGRMVGLINELREAAATPPIAVGVGVPGPMSHERGFVYAAPNLPGWVNIPLRDLLQAAVKMPVAIENDANAAAYGEYVAGAGRDARHMVMLTLGTGVGGGVIVNGKLTRGHYDNAGEVGHMIVYPGGRACPCGQLGCLERYSSASAVGERLIEKMQTGRHSLLTPRHEQGEPITSADVAGAAREGCALATETWLEACQGLALCCVNLQHILNPQRIVLAGGLINAGDQLLSCVRSEFQKLTWKIAPDHPTIELATLGGDAGTIGAAALAGKVEG